MSLIGPKPTFPAPWTADGDDVRDADGGFLFRVETGVCGELAAAIVDAVNEKYGQSKPTAQEYLDYDGNEPDEGNPVPEIGDRVRIAGASMNGVFRRGEIGRLVEVDSDDPKYLVHAYGVEDWVYGVEAV